MRKFKLKGSNPPVEYVEVWTDPGKGMVLEVTNGAHGAIGHRVYQTLLDIQRLYEEIIPEKWIVIREWSSGSIQSYIGLPFRTKADAEVFVANEEHRLGKTRYSDFAHGRYTHKVVKVE